MMLTLTITCDVETDGRAIAEVPELPGVLAYGETRADAIARVRELALAVLRADGIDADVSWRAPE